MRRVRPCASKIPKSGRGCRRIPPCRDGWEGFAPPCKLHRERPAVSSAWYQQSLAPYLIASFDPSLETSCRPVAAGIARGEVASVELPDHLAAAELVVVVPRHDAVPAALQLLERSSGEAVLDAHVPALHDTEARAVAGRLRALLVVP